MIWSVYIKPQKCILWPLHSIIGHYKNKESCFSHLTSISTTIPYKSIILPNMVSRWINHETMKLENSKKWESVKVIPRKTVMKKDNTYLEYIQVVASFIRVTFPWQPETVYTFPKFLAQFGFTHWWGISYVKIIHFYSL